MKKMWAWYDKKRDEYFHVYRRKDFVEMCSPDSFKSKTERGEGGLVEVEVRHLTSRSSRAAGACQFKAKHRFDQHGFCMICGVVKPPPA